MTRETPAQSLIGLNDTSRRIFTLSRLNYVLPFPIGINLGSDNMANKSSRKRESYHVGNLDTLLLDEARLVLAEVGPTKLSLRGVSDRVGVSATATYHHFSNKNVLLAHLAAKGFHELSQALRKRSNSSEPYDILRTGCIAYFKFARQNPELYQLMFGPEIQAERSIAELKAARAEAFGELRQIISEVTNEPADSKTVLDGALASWSFTHGMASLVIHDVIHYPSSTDIRLVDKSLKALSQIFLQGK